MKTKNIRENEKKILMEKDREIAKVSSEKGILAAFYSFMTGDAVLLPENGHPILGKNTCEKLMKHLDIKEGEGQPAWEPVLAEVSAAGNLGYTYGKKEINQGYYATIWQKDSRGLWKVAFSQGLLSLKNLRQNPLDKPIDWAKRDEKTKEVVNTERSFSKYSLEKGAPAAKTLLKKGSGLPKLFNWVLCRRLIFFPFFPSFLSSHLPIFPLFVYLRD